MNEFRKNGQHRRKGNIKAEKEKPGRRVTNSLKSQINLRVADVVIAEKKNHSMFLKNVGKQEK